MPFVANQGVKIHYEVEGSGPPIVLMHGFSGASRHWYELEYVKQLSRDFELILVDARGHVTLREHPHADFSTTCDDYS